MCKQIPEGFTPWAGGERPISLFTPVATYLRAGEVKTFPNAWNARWEHTGGDDDVIAYRVIEVEEPPRANDIQIGGNHYKDSGIQPWEVVDTWPLDQRIGFYRGNALKYAMRMGTKDEQLTEIKKAQHYLQKLVEVLEEQKGGV